MSVLAAMIDPAAQPQGLEAQVQPAAPAAAYAGAPPLSPPPIPEAPAAAPMGAAPGAAIPPPAAAAAAAGGPGSGAGSPPGAWPPIPSASPFSGGRLVDPTVTDEQKTYAMLIHLSLLLAGPMPFLSIIAPIIMWQVKKRESAFIDDHGREAVNFHLSVMLYGLIGLVLTLLLIGIPVLMAVYALGIVGIVLSSIAAKHGEYYRYPMCLRFLK